jgi:hypothetical protein
VKKQSLGLSKTRKLVVSGEQRAFADLAWGRTRLSLEKSENHTTKTVLRGLSWALVILASLPTCSKARCPFVDGPEAQCILVVTMFKFGDDLYVGLPAKTMVSNHGSLLEKESYSYNDKYAVN